MPRLQRDKKGNLFVKLEDGSFVPYALYQSRKTEVAPERPGLARFALQGAGVRAPTNIAGLGDLLASGASLLSTGAAPSGARATRFQDVTRETMSRLLPVTEPQTGPERVAESVGAGITETLPTLLLPGGPLTRTGLRTMFGGRAAGARGGLAAATGLNLAGGATGEVAGGEVRAAGGSPAAQLVAALMAGASPVTIKGILQGVSRGKTALFPAPEVKTARATRIARQQLQTEVPAPMLAEARQMLADAAKEPLFQRTTEQVLGERFPGVTGLAKRVAADPIAGPMYRQQINELDRLNAGAAKILAEQTFKGGPFPPIVQAYEKRLYGMKKAVETAYARVGELRGLPDDALRKAAAQVRLDTYPMATSLQPTELLEKIDFLRKRGTGVNLSELRQFDSLVSKTWFNDGKPLSLREQSLIGMIDDAIEKTYDDVAAAGGGESVNALRKAIKLRRLQGTRFNPEDPLYHLFRGKWKPIDFDDAFESILKRKEIPKGEGSRTKIPDAVTTLSVLKRTLAGDPKAWAGVQRLVDRQILGPEYNLLFEEGKIAKGGANQALANLRKYREVVDVAYGKGAAENAIDWIGKAERAGTQRINLAQSAPLPGESTLPQQLGGVAEVGSWNIRRALIRIVNIAIGRLPKTADEADQVFAGILFDKQIGRGALEPLPLEQIEPWKQRVGRWLARAGAEQVPRAAAGPFISEEQ